MNTIVTLNEWISKVVNAVIVQSTNGFEIKVEVVRITHMGFRALLQNVLKFINDAYRVAFTTLNQC